MNAAASLAAIPYRTFPGIEVGPVPIRTFGLFVAVGIIVGAVVAQRRASRFGVSPEVMSSLSTRLVIAGLVGARLSWVISHWREISSPIDVIAVWEGGLQFTGGFVAAIAVGAVMMRSWPLLRRWGSLDGMALGLAAGLAIGRIGCYSVGEHLGGPTTFVLGVRYLGGATREGPPAVGEVIHNTSLYEMVHLAVLAALLWWLIDRRNAAPGTAMGVFLLWYPAARFGTDFLRAYDVTVLGLTGAQWVMAALFPVGVFILARVPRRTSAARQAEAEAAPGPG